MTLAHLQRQSHICHDLSPTSQDALKKKKENHTKIASWQHLEMSFQGATGHRDGRMGGQLEGRRGGRTSKKGCGRTSKKGCGSCRRSVAIDKAAQVYEVRLHFLYRRIDSGGRGGI